MALEKNRGRRIDAGELAVVVGAGRSGIAAARLLRRAGARVRLLDSNLKALAGRESLATELADLKDVHVVVGHPLQHGDARFNAASVTTPNLTSPALTCASRAPVGTS